MDENVIKKIIKEATSTSRNSTYISPLLPGYREFEKHMNGPFTEYATNWDDPLLDHDSLDGKMSYSKKTIKKREKRAEKIAKFIKNNPDSFAWDGDAGVMNGLPGHNTDAKPLKNFDPKKTTTSLDGKIKKAIKEVTTDSTNSKGSFVPIVREWFELDDINLNEDLAVWFGKKKKPKGSSQPKGPWVNICKKVDGKHPPCGRSDTDKGAYPKCRAAGVAGKMSDSEKRAACQQKRRAEKKDTQTGKGQKPIMTSYKKKKTNEDMKRIVRLTENDLSRIVKRVLNEQTNPNPNAKLNIFCQNDIINDSFYETNLTFKTDKDINGGIDGNGLKRIFLNKDTNNPEEMENQSDFVLDVVPRKTITPEYLDQTNLDGTFVVSSKQLYLMGTKNNKKYFCSLDRGTDPSWSTYLNQL